MNNQLIEKLKDNEAHRILGDMTKEEQKCFNKNIHHVQFLGSDNGLLIWKPRAPLSPLFPESVYRIDPDWKPEPEYEDCSIQSNSFGDLGYDRNGFWLIFRATGNPKFLCFVADGESLGRCPGNVPSAYRDGMDCKVRFLK